MPTARQLQRAAKRELYKRNFALFARDQLKIKPIESGAVIPLVLNDGQMMLDVKVQKQLSTLGYVRMVALKGRQAGFSTYWQGRMYHRATLFSNFNALLVACDPDSTARIFDMCRLMYDEMDPWVKPMRRYSSKREMVFENPRDDARSENPGLRSRLDFQASTKELAGTGTTRQGLHLSEVSKFHPDSVRYLKSSLLPTIHRVPGTFLVEESTAYIGGDHFREMCETARSKRSDYEFVFVPWWLDAKNSVPVPAHHVIKLDAEERRLHKLAQRGQPKIDVPVHEITRAQFWWRRARIADVGEDMFEQEYPRDPDSAWITLDTAVFDRSVLQDMAPDLRDPLRMVEVIMGRKEPRSIQLGRRVLHDENYIAIWEEPVLGVTYDMGADVSVGTEGGDWSVAEIIRRDTHAQVAEYHKRIDVIDYGDELYWLGKYYNSAQIGVEMNGPGYATGGRLAQLAYPYIYRWRHRERDVPSLSSYAGWKTQRDSKQLMVSNGRHLFLHKQILVRSRVLWDEMHEFSSLGDGVYRAGTGADDAVMAWLIALQIMLDESFGAPKELPPEQKPIVPMSAAYRDDRDLTVKKDRFAESLIRELRGGE